MKQNLIKLNPKMSVVCPNKDEAITLYQQVQSYFDGGLVYQPENVIFDVGANIGLFSLLASQQCQGNCQLYVFEPIPEIYNYLEINLKTLLPHPFFLFPFGLGEIEQELEFTYFPKATALSTRYIEELEVERQHYYSLAKESLKEAPFPWNLLTYLPSYFTTYLLKQLINKRLESEVVVSSIKPLSKVIDDYQVERIDLLKIDVEKSELDVLQGIDLKHWNLIRQVVVEVHDLDNRVEFIKNFLIQKGFRITIRQEPYFDKLGVFTVYAQK